MATVATNHACSAELRYTQQGQLIENVLHFQNDAGFGPDSLTALGGDLIAWWIANMTALSSTGLVLTEVRLTDLESPTGPQVSVTTGLPHAGSRADAAFPMNVALAVKLLTASRGRSYRGRVYMPGLTDGMVTESRVDDSLVVSIKAAYEALRDWSFDDATVQWCVLSTVTAGAPRPAGVMTPILTIAVDNTTDSQRRRLPGRGR